MPRSAIPDTDWDAPAPPKTPGTPKREHCGAYVQGGMMSFPCTIGIGHSEVPKEDPEPHFAVEVSSSVRNWQAWAGREWERRRGSNPQAQQAEQYGTEPGGFIETPDDGVVCAAGLKGCDMTIPHTHGVDTGFEKVHLAPEVVQPSAGLPTPPAEQASALEAYLLGSGVDPEAPVWDIQCRLADDSDDFHLYEPGLTKISADSKVKALNATQTDYVYRVVQQRPVPEMGPGSDRPIEPSQLRTRAGDQPIPDGDESLADDQSLLIEDIEARRQVGIGRYGQGHRPFNGRDTLRDMYEEDLDKLVYLRSIVRMAAATREELVAEVGRALYDPKRRDKHPGVSDEEIAVDRIMGWVTAKTINKEMDRGQLVEAIRALIENDRVNQRVADMESRPFNPDAVVDKIVNQILAP